MATLTVTFSAEQFLVLMKLFQSHGETSTSAEESTAEAAVITFTVEQLFELRKLFQSQGETSNATEEIAAHAAEVINASTVTFTAEQFLLIVKLFQYQGKMAFAADAARAMDVHTITLTVVQFLELKKLFERMKKTPAATESAATESAATESAATKSAATKSAATAKEPQAQPVKRPAQLRHLPTMTEQDVSVSNTLKPQEVTCPETSLFVHMPIALINGIEPNYNSLPTAKQPLSHHLKIGALHIDSYDTWEIADQEPTGTEKYRKLPNVTLGGEKMPRTPRHVPYPGTPNAAKHHSRCQKPIDPGRSRAFELISVQPPLNVPPWKTTSRPRTRHPRGHIALKILDSLRGRSSSPKGECNAMRQFANIPSAWPTHHKRETLAVSRSR